LKIIKVQKNTEIETSTSLLNTETTIKQEGTEDLHDLVHEEGTSPPVTTEPKNETKNWWN